jgi:hypothetical protein
MWNDPSLNHLVSALEQRLRDRQPERLRGLYVDRQLERCWLLDRQLARFRSPWRARHLAAHGARLAPPWILIAATMWVAWIACLAGIASIVVTLP